MFIGIAGIIGAGKTTLAQQLADYLGYEAFNEPVDDNPYLEDFYRDMHAHAFSSQIFYLTRKFALHVEAESAEDKVVLDRSIYEDAEIFCTNLHRSRHISKRDYTTYMELYESMSQVLRPPDLLIYLRCSVRSIKQRIKQRGRKSEKDIPARYLSKLNTRYDEWIDEYSLSPVMVWDSDNMDFLTDLVDRIDFQRSLEPFLK